MPFTIIAGDSFTSNGAAKQILVPSSADYMKTWNRTKLDAASPTGCVSGEWFGPKFGVGASAANDGTRWSKAGSSAILIDKFSNSTAGDGFTYVTSNPVIEAQSANPITVISAANPAVVTHTQTYSEGDILQFYGTTGMLQIAGMNFQISSVSGSGYTLTGLRAAGFAFAGSAGYTRRISKYAAVDPQFLYVTEITKASQAVVRTSVDPTAYYVVGMKLHFSVPYSFGMVEMNALTGTILAVDATNYTMTVDIDSTAFTTFAFPASASSPTAALFATVAPAGASTKRDPNTFVETGYNVQYQAFKTGQFVPFMHLGGGQYSPAGENADIINYAFYKFEN